MHENPNPTVYVKNEIFRVAQLDVWSWLYGPPTKNVAHPWHKPITFA